MLGRSPDQLDQSPPGGFETPPSEALLDSLRAVIREVTKQPPPEDVPPGASPRPGLLQVVTLLVLAFDVVLIFILVEDTLRVRGGVNVERIISVGKMLVPAIVGAAFLAYWEEFRAGLLRFCSRPAAMGGIGGALIVLVLQLLPFPTFGVPIELVPSTVTVKVDGREVRPYPEEPLLILAGVRSRSVVVQDRILGQPHADTLILGRGRALRAAFGRVPLVGDLLGTSPIRLTAKYPVQVGKEPGPGTLIVSGMEDDFPELFLEGRIRERLATRLEGGRAEYWKPLLPDVTEDYIRLPFGAYDFRLQEGSCTRGPHHVTVTRDLVRQGRLAVDFTNDSPCIGSDAP